MAERNTIHSVHMDAPKDEGKQGDAAEPQKKTPPAKMRDLRPEKDPMGAGGGNPLTTKSTPTQS